jgi:hypothetical protein
MGASAACAPGRWSASAEGRLKNKIFIQVKFVPLVAIMKPTCLTLLMDFNF